MAGVAYSFSTACLLGVFFALWCPYSEAITDKGPSARDYCIVGAGPGGLQMGYFLQKANRDYVIFERANMSGAFFTKYPRHRKLISLNKRFTGKTNKEFNFRHDWNSLISDDESLQMRHYSKEFFPSADDYVRYLNDYSKKLSLNIQYNTNISNIQRVPNSKNINATKHFTMDDQTGRSYVCRTLIVCTGIATPNNPSFVGEEHTEGYEDMSMDLEDYEGKNVMILGNGNSGFETADYLTGVTGVIHVVGRSRVRLAWATHYVGDLRAVNNNLIDTYMLKTQNAITEGLFNLNQQVAIIKRKDGKLIVGLPPDVERLYKYVQDRARYNKTVNISDWYGFDDATVETLDFTPSFFDNSAVRDPYDKIIRCLGFYFDFDIFNSTLEADVIRRKAERTKYPTIKANYESTSVHSLFFAGTIAHSLDYRKSAGGFIHGFRYTARTLHRLLEWRNHWVPWPSVRLPISELANHIIKRINEASGTYQMFGELGDVVILTNNDTEYLYLEEYPIKLVHDIPKRSGHDAHKVFVISLEYGQNFSGPGEDVLREDRVAGGTAQAHKSNFLHPIIYFYDRLPTSEEMINASIHHDQNLPEPQKIHHIVEDFLTDFTAPRSHVLLLRRFLESCFEQDMRYYFDDECFSTFLTHGGLTLSCGNYYMKGQGLPWYAEFKELKRPDILTGKRIITFHS